MPDDLHGHKLAINGIYLTVPPTHTSEYSHGIACNQLNISADWWVRKKQHKKHPNRQMGKERSGM